MRPGVEIVTRGEWGMGRTTFDRRPVELLERQVIHHSHSHPPADHRGCAVAVRNIDDYHRRGRGWAGIGYHRVICAHGVVFLGRPRSCVGAHSQPANLDGLGYCLLGYGDDPAPGVQLEALARMMAWDARQLGRRGGLEIDWHRHVEPGTTSCPGDGIVRQLATVRRLYAARLELLEAPAPAPAPARPARVAPPFPGRHWFRIGTKSEHARAVGRQLVRLGFGTYGDRDGYQPGPTWSAYDERNVARFQRSRPELRDDADGRPGPLTWRLLHTLEPKEARP